MTRPTVKADGAMPALTIVIPTYARVDLLRACLDHLAGLDRTRADILVIDDGTPAADRLADRVAGHAANPRLMHFANGGEAVAVNRGLAAATTPYVLVLADDDKLSPDWIASGLAALEANAAIAVYPDWAVIDGTDREIDEHRLPALSADEMLANHWCIPGPGVIFRRDAALAIGGRDPRLRFTSDFDFWLRLSLHGPLVHVPGIGAYWRAHGENYSAIYTTVAARERLRIIRAHLRRRLDAGVATPRPLRRRALACAHLATAVIHTLGGRQRQAAWHFLSAWRLDRTVVANPPPNLASYPTFYPDWLTRRLTGHLEPA